MALANYPTGVTSFGNYITSAMNPMGNTYFVAASGGHDAACPFATVAYAIARGSAGDNIVLGPGTHSVDVSVSALVPKTYMQFIAAIPPYGAMPTTWITHDADDGADLVTVDVDGLGFHGIKFLHVAGGTTAVRTLSVAQTTAVQGLVFRDCWFAQNSVDMASVCSINLNDATNATTGMLIKNCRFIGADATTNVATYIAVGVGGIPDALIEDNVFCCESIDGDARAMYFADPGAGGTSYGMTIRKNDFIGAIDYGADTVPIVFEAAMTDGEIAGIIRTNYFAYCAAQAITVDSINQGHINNYYGDVATGGTLVDPGT